MAEMYRGEGGLTDRGPLVLAEGFLFGCWMLAGAFERGARVLAARDSASSTAPLPPID
jgi:hypothetical protein